jgi:ferredoxin/rubrerythrin
MANVTFKSPVMAKDVTIYAVAGHRGTILSVAKSHSIPIPFDCGDGECGSCIVEVKHVSPKLKHGISLTEKEKELLRQLGKITREEIENAEVNDMPPRYRLACQCFIRDEDIVVSFEGDRTIPAKKATLPPIKSVNDFYAYAAKVEEDAAVHYEELAASMKDIGHKDIAELFLEQADYSRTHLSQVKGEATALDPSVHLPAHFTWPHHFTPENTAVWAGEPALARVDALKAGLQGEKRGYEYYYIVADTSEIPEVAAKAKEFLAEEAEHIAVLERWIQRETARLNPGAQ